MKNYLKYVFMATGMCLTTMSCFPADKVTVVHVNDLDQFQEKSGRGGVARLSSILKQSRAKGNTVLFTHGGDMLSPSLLSSIDGGQHMVSLMNDLNLSFLGLGNHEFDQGVDNLKARLNEAKFPVVISNLEDPQGLLSQSPNLHKHLIINVGAIKIGVIGVLEKSALVESNMQGLNLSDPLTTALAESKRLRKQGADLILLSAHMPANEVRKDFMPTNAFDVILGSDDHNLDVLHQVGGPVYIQSEENARYVTQIDIDMEKKESRGKLKFKWDPSIRVIDSKTIEQDPRIKSKLDELDGRLDKALSEKIAVLNDQISSQKQIIRSQEAAIGNIITDSLRLYTGADVALYNAGGIRGNRVYEKGETITRRTLLSELPFGNRLVVIEVTGQVLKQALEHAADMLITSQGHSGAFLQVSGLSVIYDLSKPQGQRATSLMINNQPIDLRKIYTVATASYVANGGDGYTMFRGSKHLIAKAEQRKDAEVVIDMIMKRPDILHDQQSSRIQIKKP